MSEATPVILVSEMNSSLVSQCMDFTKHLAKQGSDFKFSLSLPTGFNFSMDFSQDKLTQSRMPEKKKLSPSTLKRNSLRKKLFLEKKAKEKQAGILPAGSPGQSTEVTFKCDHCEAVFEYKNTLDKHIDETHTKKFTCNECDFTTTTVKCMTDHSKLEHCIEQLDGSAEIVKSNKKKEHNDMWCYKCEEQQPNCQGWEFQFSNRPAIKAHMHNEHGITIFKDINIDDYGGFRSFMIS